MLSAWLQSPTVAEPPSFASLTPGSRTHAGLLVLKMAEKEELRGSWGTESQLSLSAMFHSSMISGKLGLLREFLLQLSLGSTAQARPGRQDTVYKQLGIERPPAPCSMLHPLLPSLLQFRIPRLHYLLSPDSRSGVRASRMLASCTEAHGFRAGLQAALWVQNVWSPVVGKGSSEAMQIWVPSLSSADWMIWTGYYTCQGICQMEAEVPCPGAVVRLRSLQMAPGSVLGKSGTEGS